MPVRTTTVFLKFSLMVLSLLLTVTLPAWGMERTKMIGVGGTVLTGLPTGDFGALVESGLGPGINIEYFATKSLVLGATFGYLLFQSPSRVTGVCTLQFCNDSTDLSWPVVQEWRMISVGAFANYIFNPERDFSFYGKGGILGNNYRIKKERVYPELPSDSSRFQENTGQVSAGLGVNFDYKQRIGIFAEFLYNRLLIKGLRVQFFSLNLGATVYFGGRKSK